MVAIEPKTTERSPLRRGYRHVSFVAAVVIADLASETIFAAPVLALVGWLGAWPGFVTSVVLYVSGSLVLSFLAVRAYDRYTHGAPSRIARYLAKESESRASKLSRRLIAGGTVLGFVVSTALAGGVVTTWLLCYTGRRQHLLALSVVSCVAWSVLFSAGYAFAGSLIF